MESKDIFSYQSFSNFAGNISSPGESLIDQSNFTTKYHEEFESHRISHYSDFSDDIFDTNDLKTYDRPVDSAPVPKLSQKEIENLKNKLQDFNKKTIHKPRDISPRPIVKSPLVMKKSEKKLSISSLTPIQSMPSYKKVLLTVCVGLNGKIFSEDVRQGDTAIEIAKRVFVQAGIQVSALGVKNLSEQVQQTISDYMLQVSQELQKFKKSSKKIQQEQAKSRLEKFKPPLLETERRAEEKKLLLGSITVNLEGEEIIVPVREGDVAERLAEKVLTEKRLKKENFLMLVQPIKDFLEQSNKKFLFRVEFDVSGKTADIGVYEGDNLNFLAQRFVREHKIGRENVSTIEEILNKQLRILDT